MSGQPPNKHTPADRRLAENKHLPPYKVSDKPWSTFSQADYTNEQWIRACLINQNTGPGKDWIKARAKLPVLEPDGVLNKNACHAAASVLAGGMGGVQATPAEKQAAARKLALYYRNWLKEPVPPSLKQMAQ